MYRIRAVRFAESGSSSGHTAAWALLYRMLKELYGIEPGREVFCRSSSGKPFLRDHPEVHFSLSHTEYAAVFVVASHPVGVDCEKITRPVSLRIRNRMLSGFDGSDQDAIFRWTCLESRVKLCGSTVFSPGFPYEELFDGSCTFTREDALLDGDYAVTVCEYAKDREESIAMPL